MANGTHSNALIAFVDRSSDSRFIERVWRSRSEEAGTFLSVAVSHWEMVVARFGRNTALIVRGPETRATPVELPAYGEWFAIRFKLGTAMPQFPPGTLLDHNAVALPQASHRAFWLNGSAMEYPSYENAEAFVARLFRGGALITDSLAAGVLEGYPQKESVRTAERRVLRATGLTRGSIVQIERARRAALLLRQGHSLADVAMDTGYYDQAHMSRSLQRFVGQSPRQIAVGSQQLSFLYNTRPTAA
jgi:hypothetical protein